MSNKPIGKDSNLIINNGTNITTHSIDSSAINSDIVFSVAGNKEAMKITADGDIFLNNGELKIGERELNGLMSGTSFVISYDDESWFVNGKKVEGDLESHLAALLAKNSLHYEPEINISELLKKIF